MNKNSLEDLAWDCRPPTDLSVELRYKRRFIQQDTGQPTPIDSIRPAKLAELLVSAQVPATLSVRYKTYSEDGERDHEETLPADRIISSITGYVVTAHGLRAELSGFTRVHNGAAVRGLELKVLYRGLEECLFDRTRSVITTYLSGLQRGQQGARQ